MNIRGYLRWQFEGTLTSPSFYGTVLSLLAFLALLTGCPQPWPMAMFVVAGIVIIGDAVWSWARFSYRIYENEQNRIIRELERKE